MRKDGPWATMLLLVLAGVLVAGGASAAEPIGTVKTATGTVQVRSSSAESEANVGTPIRLNDTVTTGPQGAVGITFTDSTMLSLGPNSEIVVDQYVYNPQGNDSSFAANMARGTLQLISGEIAKLSQNTVDVTTPGGAIAIRGTRILVEVSEPDE